MHPCVSRWQGSGGTRRVVTVVFLCRQGRKRGLGRSLTDALKKPLSSMDQPLELVSSGGSSPSL